jgi:hypothetical protein
MPQNVQLIFATLVLLSTMPLAAQPAYDIELPSGYRHLVHVNTMVVDVSSGRRCAFFLDAGEPTDSGAATSRQRMRGT